MAWTRAISNLEISSQLQQRRFSLSLSPASVCVAGFFGTYPNLEIRMLPLTVESLMGGPPSPSLPSSFFPISP